MGSWGTDIPNTSEKSIKYVNELLSMRYGDMSAVTHSDSECLTNVTITVKHSEVS